MTKKDFKKGFTLIEIMTALSVFAVVMTISVGSILGVFDANRKSEALKTVMDNLNLSVESMSREMRFGRNYHCGDIGFGPQDCNTGDSFMTFLASDGVTQISYKQNGGEIEKSVDGVNFVPVTAPEINIETLKFFVLGTDPSDARQPKVLIIVKGSAGTKETSRTDFTVQTLVSQRPLDK